MNWPNRVWYATQHDFEGKPLKWASRQPTKADRERRDEAEADRRKRLIARAANG